MKCLKNKLLSLRDDYRYNFMTGKFRHSLLGTLFSNTLGIIEEWTNNPLDFYETTHHTLHDVNFKINAIHYILLELIVF